MQIWCETVAFLLPFEHSCTQQQRSFPLKANVFESRSQRGGFWETHCRGVKPRCILLTAVARSFSMRGMNWSRPEFGFIDGLICLEG